MKQTVIATCGKGQNHDDKYGGEFEVHEAMQLFFLK